MIVLLVSAACWLPAISGNSTSGAAGVGLGVGVMIIGRGLLMSGWVMVATYQPHARFLLGATTNIVHNSLIYTSARHLVADLNGVDGSQSLYFFKMSVYRLADLPFSFTSGSTPNRFLSSNYDVRNISENLTLAIFSCEYNSYNALIFVHLCDER